MGIDQRVGYDLHVHAVLFVFARVEGEVGGDPVDRQECPVQDQLRLHGCGPYGFGECVWVSAAMSSTASVTYR